MHTNNSLVLAQISVLHVHEEVDKLVWDISIICYQELLNMQWHPTPVLLPGKLHGRRSLVGCSPWGHEESDTTERLYVHFSLSCTGEGNGNPLQCSCLENPRDGGAWWAAMYGVAQSRTRLKWLSSSSSSKCGIIIKVRNQGEMSRKRRTSSMIHKFWWFQMKE